MDYTNTTPRFAHAFKTDKFLGRYFGYDLYCYTFKSAWEKAVEMIVVVSGTHNTEYRPYEYQKDRWNYNTKDTLEFRIARQRAIKLGFIKDYQQNNPKDQARVIIGSARGSLSNLEDGTSHESAITQINNKLDELGDLVEKYMSDSWAK